MKMFMFKSGSREGLHAFADDDEGSRLPERHGPWKGMGSVAATRPLPYALPRATIEAAVRKQGFQLWRMRAKERQPSPTES